MDSIDRFFNAHPRLKPIYTASGVATAQAKDSVDMLREGMMESYAGRDSFHDFRRKLLKSARETVRLLHKQRSAACTLLQQAKDAGVLPEAVPQNISKWFLAEHATPKRFVRDLIKPVSPKINGLRRDLDLFLKKNLSLGGYMKVIPWLRVFITRIEDSKNRVSVLVDPEQRQVIVFDRYRMSGLALPIDFNDNDFVLGCFKLSQQGKITDQMVMSRTNLRSAVDTAISMLQYAGCSDTKLLEHCRYIAAEWVDPDQVTRGLRSLSEVTEGFEGCLLLLDRLLRYSKSHYSQNYLEILRSLYAEQFRSLQSNYPIRKSKARAGAWD